MKKPLLIPVLICFAVLAACAQGRKTAKGEAAPKAGKAPAQSLTSATMRRGACFGKCPEYTITINSSGLAEYTGKRNAEPLGVYQKNIGAAAAQALLKEFAQYRVDTCQDLYRVAISDLPGLHYTFIINGKEKKIGNANFGPDFLIIMSDQMDALGKVDASWKKIRDIQPE
jgi:hypothetical protein